MPWMWAALMPHPPVIIPEVGRGRELEASVTLDGTANLCARLNAVHASAKANERPLEMLLVLSPHQPYVPGALFINNASSINGNLARFGAPSAAIAANTPADALQSLAAALEEAGIPVVQGKIHDISDDHGSIVPLRALAPLFPDGLPPCIIASPSGLTPEQALLLGKTLRTLAPQEPWALLASGDLSHRLKPGAPAGYHPAGKLFDQAVVSALRAGDPAVLMELPPDLIAHAGECGLRSVLAMLALCSGPAEVFSYEGPFGVGYCNALWSLFPEDTGRG